jgi:hypothetical protein
MKKMTSATAALSQRQIRMVRSAINDIRKWTNDGMGTDYNLDAPSINQQLVNYNAITRK